MLLDFRDLSAKGGVFSACGLEGDRERGVQEPFVKDPARVIDAQELVVP